jgi:hypothetical protein
MRVVRLTMLAALAALALSQTATAALTVCKNGTASGLRVDAAGNAEVSWTAGGRRHTMLVRPGAGLTEGALSGSDVSEAVRGEQVPFQRMVRSAPGGWYYALQAWRMDANGPTLLRFSRWRGVPTEVTLAAKKAEAGVRLSGRATFDEKPLPKTSQRRYVYLDSLIGGTWRRVSRVLLPSSGSYAHRVSKANVGDSYRVVLPGPNFGTTYAPDGSSVVDAPFDLDPHRLPR